MCSRPRRTALHLAALACLCAAFPSCRRAERPAITRLAVLRFENLTGDRSLNWMGRAASQVISAELAGSTRISTVSFNTLGTINSALGERPTGTPGVSAERTAALLAHATEILLGRISRVGSNLIVNATIYGEGGKISRTLEADGPFSSGIIPLAGSLAGQIDKPVRPYETANEQALQKFSEGLESSGAEAFSLAVAADPNFGAAYVAWASLAVAQNNRTEAEHVLGAAAAHGGAFSAIERARLAVIAAELRGDAGAAAQALAAVERLNPADQGVVRQIAQAYLNARRYGASAVYWQKAASAEPDDAVLWNQLGYTEMYAGNLEAARQAIGEYMRLRPDDPNASDSMGDVNFGLGQFAEAENNYRASAQKNPNFNGGSERMKAARARVMSGDVSGADSVLDEYLAARRRAGDPAIDFRHSLWEFLTGRRSEAVARLSSFAAGANAQLPAGLASQCYAQLAIWRLESGDRSGARECALKATAGKTVTVMGVMARLLTEPPAAAPEWTARIERAVPGPAQERARDLILSYALLLSKDYRAAVDPLRRAFLHSTPSPHETLPVLLAWALVESGRAGEAAPLLARNPIPEAEGADLFESLVIPRLFFLRGEALAGKNNAQEARRNLQLFLTLAGPGEDIFGDRAKARQALSSLPGSDSPLSR